MNYACERKEMHTEFVSKTHRKRTDKEKPGVDERVIMKAIVKKLELKEGVGKNLIHGRVRQLVLVNTVMDFGVP
jgi:hypothetical protein